MNKKNVLNILVAARWLISDPDNWTKRVLARNNHGRKVVPTSKKACAWCAMGAIMSSETDFSDMIFARNKVRAAANAEKLSVFNDHRKHDQVLAAFDKAIARLSAEIDA